tara:strand:+ start:1632 stop:2807 length:1176 start_codon:yes stop_codon:yes gene_type:complete
MARYTLMNPGLHHLGTPFTYPPMHNRTYDEKYLIKEIKWKTSCMLNRRIYIGNVQIKDVNNTVKVLSDSIFKSKANKFDSFTLDRRIDVAIGDGDEIVKLIAYADRILEFKHNILHIINATKGAEYLEASYKFKGVSHPSAVCETDYGIFWCNSHGAYFYNGKEVSEILVRKGIRVISHEAWNDFYLEGQTMVSYVPKTKQVLFIRGNNTATDNIGNIMIYNLLMGSFTKGTNRLDEDDKTNIVNIWDGRPAWGRATGGAVTIYPWDSDALAVITNYKVQTKEFNFGTEAKKKIKKVRISYKGGSSGNVNIVPKYAINNGDFNNSFIDENGNTITNLPYSTNWVEKDLFIQSASDDARSFAVELGKAAAGNVVSDFKVNDITIIYRLKSVK